MQTSLAHFQDTEAQQASSAFEISTLGWGTQWNSQVTDDVWSLHTFLGSFLDGGGGGACSPSKFLHLESLSLDRERLYCKNISTIFWLSQLHACCVRDTLHHKPSVRRY